MRSLGSAGVSSCLALLFLGGCGCSSKNGSEPTENGGEGGNSGERGTAELPPRPRLSRTAPDSFPLPPRAKPGEWVERVHRELGASPARVWTERISVVEGFPDGSLWIEVCEDRSVERQWVVTRLLVRTDGSVVEGLRGYKDDVGEKLELRFSPPLVAGEPSEVAPEPVKLDLAGESWSCRVETYRLDGTVRKIYRSDEVPYDGVAKIEDPRELVELAGYERTGAKSHLKERS